MNVLVPYLMALHQQDLLEEAELARRARLFEGSHATVPAWRRRLGGLVASVARSLDPTDERASEPAIVSGREVNALPTC